MGYQIKPLSCDPANIKGMSERLIVSHYENNYVGAVKRLNLIEEQLAELDYAKAAGFLINGVKREQLIAMNSMILHELFFDGLGDQSEPSSALREALARNFGSFERWRAEFVAMGKALGGWTAFKPAHGGAMVMGDLVLLDTEINPVMAKLMENGIEITAVHNHVLRANPATYYMHISGHGDPVKLATALHTALAESKTPLGNAPMSPTAAASSIDLDTAAIDKALGYKGKVNGGVYQFNIPRAFMASSVACAKTADPLIEKNTNSTMRLAARFICIPQLVVAPRRVLAVDHALKASIA